MTDGARSLIAANAVTLAMALAFRWPLSALLWPYWIQSVVIGYFSRKRMLALDQFSIEGYEPDERETEPTEDTKRSSATFFTLHYGFFHFVYAVFIGSRASELAPWDWLGIAIAGISFVWNHRQSYLRNIEADTRGKPNLGTMMFLPYLRVIPMHLTILIGGALSAAFSPVAIVFFCLMKTGADVVMHRIEHRLLRR